MLWWKPCVPAKGFGNSSSHHQNSNGNPGTCFLPLEMDVAIKLNSKWGRAGGNTDGEGCPG